MADDVRLRIEGQDHGGWKSVRIQRSLDATAGTFDLSVSETWAVTGSNGSRATVHRPVRPGQACQVLIGGETVITGHVDDVEPSYDASKREVSVRGRDAAADLVDCSAVPGDYKGRTVSQLAAVLCEPFGITVQARTDVGAPLETFTVPAGETVFDALERACRQRGLLLASDGLGGVLLTRASGERIAAVIEQGRNVLEGRATLSWRRRFSHIVVIGQGDAGRWTGAGGTEPNGAVTDPEITRYRPRTVEAETGQGTASYKERAAWERAVARGRGARFEYTVPGWTHAEGLWTPNTRVRVKDAWLGVDEALLVADVTFVKDTDRGTRTELVLMPPEAFNRLPEAEATAQHTWAEAIKAGA
jgi:prophage tail gpP-like protein